jgi:hypothetical protein
LKIEITRLTASAKSAAKKASPNDSGASGSGTGQAA